MATVSLSSGVRNALTSLASTKADAQMSQYRLATGKKVNSAVDSPVNFFTAASLNDRAGQLTDLLDGISNGVQTIQAASKGIDSITSMVKSLQSTIKQAQNDAAANRPKITSGAGLASEAEAAARGSSIRETALNKTVLGAAAPATSGSAGNIGVTTAGAGVKTLQISAGATTYAVSISGTDTLRDLVNNINASGIATASVGQDGKLTVTGTGSDALSLTFGQTAAGAFTADPAGTGGDANADALFGDGAASVDTTTAAEITNVAVTANSVVRTNLVSQFNDLRGQLDGIARDSGFNGINLLGGDKLSITFNEKTGAAKNKLDVQGQEITADNLGIGQAVDGTASTGDYNIQNDADLAKAADALTNVLTNLRSTASTLGSQLSVVQTRQDFTKDLVNTLTVGADNLTLADTNEEGAKLLALQTRQQLSQTALSLSNQADQAVLRLF